VSTSQVGKSTLYFSDLFRLVLIVILRYAADMYSNCTNDVLYQIGQNLQEAHQESNNWHLQNE